MQLNVDIRAKVVSVMKGMLLSDAGEATQNSYERISSGRRTNHAADDAAGLAISQKLLSQSNGLSKGIENGLAMNDLAQTAEGSLGSMNDDLQRIRELAVQASNGTLTDGDKKIIQNEIEQLKGSISDTAKNTEFNTQKLLDGTFTNKNIALNPQGTGTTMSIQDSSLASLGIDNFDVTGDFDISDIDNAITKVTDSRSNLGATSNGIMRATSANTVAEYNTEAAESQIGDVDIASEVVQQNIQQILQQYQMYAQKQTMAQKSSSLSLLG